MAHPAVEPAHAIHFLASVASEDGHAEAFVVVVGVLTTHADEFVPGEAKSLRIAAHVFAKKLFVKVVVSSGNGGMDGIERGGTNELEGFVERSPGINVVAESL